MSLSVGLNTDDKNISKKSAYVAKKPARPRNAIVKSAVRKPTKETTRAAKR
jgi:hypothetical protein